MAATGYTPIYLYYSSTATNAPAAGNLGYGELAINITDKNLFFKDNTNAVNTVPIRQSSASSNGWLSSTDWSTFNGKAPAVTYTSQYVPFGQGTTSLNQSATFTYDGSYVYLKAADPRVVLQPSTTTNLACFQAVNSGGTALMGLDSSGAALTAPYALNLFHFGNYPVTISTNATERMRVFGSGGVSIGNTTDPGAANLSVSGNVVIATSGKGIDFSATAGTGTSELLADYEEGTWTPTQGVGLTVVGTFSSSGTYTKVGRLVTVTASLNATTSIVASAGGIACGGLPYTVSGAHVGSLSSNALNQSGSVSAYGTNVYSGSTTSAATGLILTVTYMV